MGPAAGWRWLMDAVNLGGRNTRAVFGGAALLMVVALVPTLVQLVMQQGMGMTGEAATLGLLGFSLLYSLLLMGPLSAGYLRVLHASETGAPTRPGAIFQVFGGGQGAGSVIAMLLGLTVIGLLLFGLLAMVFGGDFFARIGSWMMALETAEPGTTPDLPALPDGIGTLMGLLFILGLFFNGVYAIALGQVALGRTGPGTALADGLLGALRNLLPLLVLTVVVMVLGLVALLVVALVVALLAGLGSLVHPALGIALAAPVYLAVLVGVYVVMFGVMYAIWRDVCAAPPDAGGGQHEVAA